MLCCTAIQRKMCELFKNICLKYFFKEVVSLQGTHIWHVKVTSDMLDNSLTLWLMDSSKHQKDKRITADWSWSCLSAFEISVKSIAVKFVNKS